MGLLIQGSWVKIPAELMPIFFSCIWHVYHMYMTYDMYIILIFFYLDLFFTFFENALEFLGPLRYLMLLIWDLIHFKKGFVCVCVCPWSLTPLLSDFEAVCKLSSVMTNSDTLQYHSPLYISTERMFNTGINFLKPLPVNCP